MVNKITVVGAGNVGATTAQRVAEKELAGTSGKLGNEAFLAKAPEAVVEKIRGRKQVAEEEIARITVRLTELGQA